MNLDVQTVRTLAEKYETNQNTHLENKDVDICIRTLRKAQIKHLSELRLTPIVEQKAKSLFKSAQARAKEKNWEFDLDVQWIIDKISTRRCEATGRRFEFHVTSKTKDLRPWQPSLDRIQATGGYTKSNTQVVCWIYNRAKGAGGPHTVAEMAWYLLRNTWSKKTPGNNKYIFNVMKKIKRILFRKREY